MVFAKQLGVTSFPAALGAIFEREPDAFRYFVMTASVMLIPIFLAAFAVGKWAWNEKSDDKICRK